MPIERVCLYCHTVFTVSPSRLTGAHPSTYCSKRCYNTARAAQTLTCPQCGRVFKPGAWRLEAQSGVAHCSLACWQASTRVTFTCQRCGKSFTLRHADLARSSGTYCSPACVQAPLLERFWTAVQRCDHTPWCLYCCWLWTGALRKDGYGVIWYDGKQRQAHRISWEIHNQRPFPGTTRREVILHLCNHPTCVNPWHLQYGSQHENIQMAIALGRFTQLRPRKRSYGTSAGKVDQ